MAYSPANCSRHCCRNQTVAGQHQIDVFTKHVPNYMPHSAAMAHTTANCPHHRCLSQIAAGLHQMDVYPEHVVEQAPNSCQALLSCELFSPCFAARLWPEDSKSTCLSKHVLEHTPHTAFTAYTPEYLLRHCHRCQTLAGRQQIDVSL